MRVGYLTDAIQGPTITADFVQRASHQEVLETLLETESPRSQSSRAALFSRSGVDERLLVLRK